MCIVIPFPQKFSDFFVEMNPSVKFEVSIGPIISKQTNIKVVAFRLRLAFYIFLKGIFRFAPDPCVGPIMRNLLTAVIIKLTLD